MPALRFLFATAAALALSIAGLPGAPTAVAQGYYDDDPDGPPPMPAGNGGYEDDQSYANGPENSGSDETYDPEADDADEYEDGRGVPDVTYFYDELEEDGRWVRHPSYGQVWIPRGTDRDWRPYTRGHWINTDEYGWYWVSDEPFGWATYHYGRWYYDGRYGWVWVPGTRWAPAWVAWRSNDDYLGWAPLPPDAYWEPRHGLRYDMAIYESSRFSMYWSFIEPAYIIRPNIYRHCLPRDRARTIIYRTRPETNYVFSNRRIINRGVSVRHIEDRFKIRIGSQRLTISNDRKFRGSDRHDGDAVSIFRPKLTHHDQLRIGKPAKKSRGTDFWHDVNRSYKKPKPSNSFQSPQTYGRKGNDGLPGEPRRSQPEFNSQQKSYRKYEPKDGASRDYRPPAEGHGMPRVTAPPPDPKKQSGTTLSPRYGGNPNGKKDGSRELKPGNSFTDRVNSNRNRENTDYGKGKGKTSTNTPCVPPACTPPPPR